MEIVTLKFLKAHHACANGIKYVTDSNLIGLPGNQLVEKLIENNKFDWANWLIVRIMTNEQRLHYAIFAAEQVLENFELQYANDKRTRQAIKAAKKCLENPSTKNRKAAQVAVNLYRSAANSADLAASAAYSAAYSAVRLAADSPAYSAYSAACSAANSAYSAAYTDDSTDDSTADSAYLAMLLKIVNYGSSLI